MEQALSFLKDKEKKKEKERKKLDTGYWMLMLYF